MYTSYCTRKNSLNVAQQSQIYLINNEILQDKQKTLIQIIVFTQNLSIDCLLSKTSSNEMKRRLINSRTETTEEYYIENFNTKVKTIRIQETITGLNSSCFVEISPKYSQNGNEYLSIRLHIEDKKERKIEE